MGTWGFVEATPKWDFNAAPEERWQLAPTAGQLIRSGIVQSLKQDVSDMALAIRVGLGGPMGIQTPEIALDRDKLLHMGRGGVLLASMIVPGMLNSKLAGTALAKAGARAGIEAGAEAGLNPAALLRVAGPATTAAERIGGFVATHPNLALAGELAGQGAIVGAADPTIETDSRLAEAGRQALQSLAFFPIAKGLGGGVEAGANALEQLLGRRAGPTLTPRAAGGPEPVPPNAVSIPPAGGLGASAASDRGVVPTSRQAPIERITPFETPGRDAPNLQPVGLMGNEPPGRLVNPPKDVTAYLGNQDVVQVDPNTGHVQITGWRATPQGVNPVAPGHGESVFIGSSPGEVYPFLHGLSFFDATKEMANIGKLYQVKTTLEKPFIADGWDSVRDALMGSDNIERFNKLANQKHALRTEFNALAESDNPEASTLPSAVVATREHRLNQILKEIKQLDVEMDELGPRHQDQMIATLKKQGYDGLVLTNGWEFDTEVVDFKPGRAEVTNTVDPRDHFDQLERVINAAVGNKPNDPNWLNIRDDLSIADTLGAFTTNFGEATNITQSVLKAFPGIPDNQIGSVARMLVETVKASNARAQDFNLPPKVFNSLLRFGELLNSRPEYANELANLAQELRGKYGDIGRTARSGDNPRLRTDADLAIPGSSSLHDYVDNLRLQSAYNDAAKSTGLDPALLEFRPQKPSGFEGSRPASLNPQEALDVEGLIKSEVYRPEVGRVADIVRSEMGQQAIDDAVRRIEPIELLDTPQRQLATWAKEGNQVARLTNVVKNFFGDESDDIVKRMLLTGNMDGIAGKVPARAQAFLEKSVAKIRGTNGAVAPEPAADVAPWSLGHEHDAPVMATWDILRKMGNGQLTKAVASAETAVKQTSPELRLYAGLPFDKIPASVLARIAFGTTGAATIAGTDADDPSTTTHVARSLGYFLLAAAAFPTISKELGKLNFVRAIARSLDSRFGLAAPARDAIDGGVNTINMWETAGTIMKRQIEQQFPDKQLRATVTSLLEDPQADMRPEFHLLNEAQQKTISAIHIMNNELGGYLKDQGLIKELRQDYVRLMFPPEAAQKFFKDFAWGTLAPGGFVKERLFPTVTEAAEWAKKNGIAPPELDIGKLQDFHLREVGKAVAVQQIKSALTDVGLLQTVKSTAPDKIPDGWRQVQVAGIGNQVAPDDVAHAIEVFSQRNRLSKVGLVRGLESIRTSYMIAINLIGMAHAVNMVRAVLAEDPLMKNFGRSIAAIKQADPSLLEAASHGAMVMGRGDFEHMIAGRAYDSFDSTLGKLGFGGPVKGVYKWAERKVFDELVPAAVFMTYQNEVARLVKKDPSIVNDTARYNKELQKIAGFANAVGGQIPKYIQDPEVKTILGQLLFSPSWTRTRLALTMNAAREAGDLGQPNNPMYLRYYMRKVALGIAATYAIQQGMNYVSGNKAEVQYNPHTQKVYAQSPYTDKNGRALGIDLLGWWQDDLKLFNDPLKLLYGKLSPQLRAIGEFVSGTNYLGQPVEGIDRVEQALQSFGTPVGWAETALRTAQDVANGGIRPETAVRGGMDALSVGSATSLPRSSEMAIDRLAKRLLSEQGLPSDDSRVFDLGRILKSNLTIGAPLIDGRVVDYLVYQRRGYADNSPFSSWLRLKMRTLSDMTQ